MNCSIVIRCYNEEKHIGKLLHGIMQQTVQDVEIIIVDSGSTDGTVQIASRFPVEIATIRPEIFSFGRSLNFGCNMANKDLIVIASAHVYPLYRDWLEQLLQPLNDTKISLTYGRQVGGEKTKLSEHQVFSKWFPDLPNPQQRYPFCNNANAAIRNDVWHKHPYNEDLTGLEDIDWAHTAMQAGHKIAYCPNAVVAHIHKENYMQIFNRYRREALAFKTIFPNEKFSLFDFLRLFFFNIFSDYYFAIRSGKLQTAWHSIPAFRLMQFWGTYCGFQKTGHVSEQLKRRLYYPKQKNPVIRSPKKIQKKEALLIDYSAKERSYRENR